MSLGFELFCYEDRSRELGSLFGVILWKLVRECLTIKGAFKQKLDGTGAKGTPM